MRALLASFATLRTSHPSRDREASLAEFHPSDWEAIGLG